MNALTADFETRFALGTPVTMIGKFREKLAEIAGIEIGPAKESLIRHRLNKRINQTNAGDIDSYLDLVMHDPDWEEELMVAIDMMTTNTTYFFREEAHFDFMAGTIVPDLAESASDRQFQVNVWSAAASEGAEAYTAAMVLSELKLLHPGMEYSIIGTDISPSMVATANAAIYRQAQIDKVPEYLRRRYLLVGKGEDTKDRVRFAKSIRSRVKFGQMNLKDDHYPVPPNVDIAFLRNVLIYFGPEDQANVISRVASKIKIGGYLFVGHAESMIVNHPRLVQIAPSIFRKM